MMQRQPLPSRVMLGNKLKQNKNYLWKTIVDLPVINMDTDDLAAYISNSNPPRLDLVGKQVYRIMHNYNEIVSLLFKQGFDLTFLCQLSYDFCLYRISTIYRRLHRQFIYPYVISYLSNIK